MLEQNNCEMCGADAWTPLKGDEWKRCICGHLEIALPQRSCSDCGEPLGRYTKKSTAVCVACKGDSEHRCKTMFCYNQLDKKSKGGFCQECLVEMKQSPNGHLWKELASYIFQNPTQLKTATTMIKTEYPYVTKSRLANWIIKHWRADRIKKIARGIYQVKEHNDRHEMD